MEDVGKLDLNFEERGEGGVPVVLLHGFPFDHTIWNDQLAEVGKVARVLAPDLPGFGQSAALPDAEPSMDRYADEVATWARGLGLDRLILVGHSMGGYVAFAFARRHPEMLAGLGLVCTRPGPDTEQAREGRYALINQVWEKGAQAVADSMLPKLFAPVTKEKRPELVEQNRELMLRQSVPGIVSALRAMATRPDSTPMLGNIDVPTLVVSGQEDAIIPAVEADLMASSIVGAARETIESSGHMPMLEKPKRLGELLQGLARGGRTNPGIPEPPPRNDIADVRSRA